MKKIVKVFHPRWSTSFAVKKALEKYRDYEVQIHEDIEFDMDFEQRQLAKISQLVILFPMYTYAPPYNYKYWVDKLDYFADYSHINMWIHTTVSGSKEWYFKTEPCTPAEFLKPIERTWAQIMRANVLGIKVDHVPPKKRIGK